MTLQNLITTLSTFAEQHPEALHLEVYASDSSSLDPVASIIPEPELCHVDSENEWFNQDSIDLIGSDEMPINAVVC